MNALFRQYVTSSAFNLNLSANMISALEHLASVRPTNGWAEFDRPVWSAKDALLRRGLITNIGTHGADLTEEGWLVLTLCSLAGLTVSTFTLIRDDDGSQTGLRIGA